MGKTPIADIPGYRDVIEVLSGSQASDIATTERFPVHVMGRDATFTSAYWIPSASMAGATDHTRSVVIGNGGSSGTEATVLASINLTDATVEAHQAVELTLNATASNLDLNSGDVLFFLYGKTGNGVDVPGALYQIEYT